MPEFPGRLRTPRLAAAPGSPVVGELYYNTANNKLYYWNGTAWVDTTGGGGVSGPELPKGCSMRGSWTVVGGGGWTQPPAGYTTEWENPAGSVANNRDFTVPETGVYRVSAWVQLENAAVGKQAGFRILRNGTFYGPPNGLVRIHNGVAAMYPAAGGSVDYTLNAGDVMSVSVFHDDTTSRTLTWYYTIEKVENLPGPRGESGAVLSDIPLVSTLPVSPVNGEEVYYQNSAMFTTYGAIWHLRYNSSYADAYKWEFLGGSPLEHEVSTYQNPPVGGAWTNLATDGPLVTVPLAGIYRTHCGANLLHNARNIQISMGVAIGDGTPAGQIDGQSPDTGVAFTNPQQSGQSRRDRLTAAAGNIIKTRYWGEVSGGNVGFGGRWLDVTPMRVI